VPQVLYNGAGWVNANRGDGTFAAKVSINLNGESKGGGGAAADLDNDGDPELMIGGWFVRNTTVETASLGQSCSFGQCLHRTTCIFNNGDCRSYYNMLPAVGDVDGDGDLDVGQVFMANYPHRLLRNRLYGPECEEPLKRYVKVRPVRPLDPNVEGPNGRDYTENEFGARVELVVRNDLDAIAAHVRRVQITSSAAGYLTQNEYPLHFGLPGDPDPSDPNEDLRFDLYVDFIVRGNEPEVGSGVWRVDWTVNPQLKNINLAQLYVDCNDVSTWGRPITVYRDGRVRFKGADPNWEPNDPNIARMYTLGGPLLLPEPNNPLPDLASGSFLAGVRFKTEPNCPELRIREIIVDGQLDQNTYGCDYNVVVLDVTDPNAISPMGRLKAYTFPDNRRTFIHVPEQDPNEPDFVLPRTDSSTTRKYEVRVRVTSYRLVTLADLAGLQALDWNIVVDKGLRLRGSSAADICTVDMDLRNDAATPVTIRLSATGN
jgi:hypothetical protein